jgi:hypothetical protein
VKVGVYTAIAGDYPIKRTDIQCFTGDGIFQRSVMEAKRYKILPHLFMDADVTIWLDGNISLRATPQSVVDELLGGADMALFHSPYRETVWGEFAALKADRRFAIPYLQHQLEAQRVAYRGEGLPDNATPFECNFIIRRNNAIVNRLMESWWAQICRWQWRDQVSLPYVLWKYGGDVRLQVATGVNIRDHPLFDYVDQYA